MSFSLSKTTSSPGFRDQKINFPYPGRFLNWLVHGLDVAFFSNSSCSFKSSSVIIFAPLYAVCYYSSMDYKTLIDKAIYGLMGLIGTVLIKYVSDLNQNIRQLMLSQSRNEIRLEYIETHARDLEKDREIIYRIENQLAIYERRISRVEKSR
jgi:hypothetical protein